METRPIRPANLILYALIGVASVLFFGWLWRTYPNWIWPWGGPVLVLVAVALLAWEFVERRRRHQRQP